ncbi:MAG: glycosyltransferase [Bacteroidia bacterium]|nr:glycosyltransferase [Bacteroidia bacterium]
MSYRFIRVTDNYPQYIQSYYEKNKQAHLLSYDEQYKAITNHSIEIVSSFGRCLRELGVDAFEIISNDKVLQSTWAKEHGVKENASDAEIIFEQLKFYRPEIIWLDTTVFLNKEWVNRIKSEIKGLKLIVGHICAPYNNVIGSSFSHFDIMFTCTPCFVKEIEEQGGNPYLLYHSFDDQVLKTLETEVNSFPENDFVFTGSLLTGYGLHKTRIEYLEEFLRSNINLTIYGNIESQKTIRMKQLMHYTIKTMLSLGMEGFVDGNSFLRKYKKYADAEINNYSKRLINSIREPVFGLDMFKLLQHSKICFNIHGEIAKVCGGNIRLFEATGAGTCLVTDNKKNMQDLFDVDNEIVVYNNMEECVEKVKWLLDNPVKAAEIAKAGQQRTLKDHTVKKRASELNGLFLERLRTK